MRARWRAYLLAGLLGAVAGFYLYSLYGGRYWTSPKGIRLDTLTGEATTPYDAELVKRPLR